MYYFVGAMIGYHYKDYAEPFLDELVTEEIAMYNTELKASAEMNHTRWSEEQEENPYYSSREESFRELENFVAERKDFLDAAWLNLK